MKIQLTKEQAHTIVWACETAKYDEDDYVCGGSYEKQMNAKLDRIVRKIQQAFMEANK